MTARSSSQRERRQEVPDISDGDTTRPPSPDDPRTIAEVLEGGEPMGDLSRFAIDDLTPEEEDEFFRILEDL